MLALGAFWNWGMSGVDWRMEGRGMVREEDAIVGVVVRVARGRSRGRDFKVDAIVSSVCLSLRWYLTDSWWIGGDRDWM